MHNEAANSLHDFDADENNAVKIKKLERVEGLFRMKGDR